MVILIGRNGLEIIGHVAVGRNRVKTAVYSEEQLIDVFVNILSKEGQDAFHQSTGFLKVGYMREKYPSLFIKLKDLAQFKHGKRNSSLILADNGFHTNREIGLKEAKQTLKRYVVTKKAVIAIYDGAINDLSKLAREHLNPYVRKSYQVVSRSANTLGFKTFVNNAYPDLKSKYGLLSFDGAVDTSVIKRNLRRRFLREQSLAYRGQRDPESRAVDEKVRNTFLTGELPLEVVYNNGRTRPHTGKSHIQKKLHYLSEIRGLEKIVSRDLEHVSSRRETGAIAEYEARLFFNIAKRHPEVLSFAGINKYVGQSIDQVITNSERKLATIYEPYLGRESEVDLRLVVVNGRRKDAMIDVKSYRYFSKRVIYEIVHDYAPIDHFLDGKKIDKKIILMNANTEKESEASQIFKENGITLLPGAVFNEAYIKAIDYLTEQDFANCVIPIAGTLEEKKQKLLRIHEFVYDKVHLLNVQGSRFLLEWSEKLLRSLSDGFDNVPEFVFGRRKYDSLPTEIIMPFSEIEDKYDLISSGSLERLAEFAKDVVFYDTETAGILHEGYPITVLGMAYIKDGVPVLHQFFAKDPLDEKPMLREAHKIMSSRKYLIGVNSKTFDDHMFIERLFANRLLFNPHIVPVDVLPFLRSYGHRLPNNRLQTYEQLKLATDIRKTDLGGSEVAEAFRVALLGGPVDKLGRIAEHNLYDGFSTAFMTLDLYEAGAFRLPK